MMESSLYSFTSIMYWSVGNASTSVIWHGTQARRCLRISLFRRVVFLTNVDWFFSYGDVINPMLGISEIIMRLSEFAMLTSTFFSVNVRSPARSFKSKISGFIVMVYNYFYMYTVSILHSRIFARPDPF